MSDLEEFIEEAKRGAASPLIYSLGEYRGREFLAERGCDGTGEYAICSNMSEDYARLAREHATMLRIIEAAQRRGRYLDDAYEDATA